MKRTLLSFLMVFASVIPSVCFAKGVPLFFQTGDELFEIEGAPALEGGYTVGYACKRFGLLGADVWTWDCDLMAVNLEEFSAGDLDDAYKAEMSQKYTLGDRKRDPWNHYGIAALAVLLVGGVAVKAKNR